ncbi:MAG: MCE family protein [Saprospiraceae bacterium]|nr:MCE family protein [Saprospiraceae bacterium]
MEKQDSRNIKLGAMVLLGTLFLIMSLYFIGNHQNMFRSTFKIYADFKHVDGLLKGNTVRFAGIDIGTVKSVDIISDSSIRVSMVLKNQAKDFLKKNAIASISTDGLMGNKIVSISTVNVASDFIEDGDMLQTIHPVGTDEILRKLSKTNDDISVIASNIRTLTEKMQHPDALVGLLGDTIISKHIKDAVFNIRVTSQRTATITGDLSNIIKETKEGKGLIGGLLTDTSFTDNLNQTIVTINAISDTLAEITGDFRFMSKKISSGEGAIGAILMDTTIVPQLNLSLKNIEYGSKGAGEIMDALKQSFLFRGYFKKKEKERLKQDK